jgi:hypothetical protein
MEATDFDTGLGEAIHCGDRGEARHVGGDRDRFGERRESGSDLGYRIVAHRDQEELTIRQGIVPIERRAIWSW